MGNVEQQVRQYYDVAGPAYASLMDDVWHHGKRDAEERGLSPVEAGRELAEELVRAGGLQPGGRALDFGSGVGGSTIHMAAVSRATWIGVSNNEWLSDRARGYAQEHGLADQVFFHTIGDEEYKTLGAWPDASFDVVSFYESVCHLPDKQQFFNAAHRLLKPGGHLVGIDWLQRPFGDNQTEEQIRRWMEPVERLISIPWHGTVQGYREMIEKAGFEVKVAEDMWSGVECWGSTPPDDSQGWLSYDGEEGELFQDGKRALDAARGAGVFTIGQFVAAKPS